MKIEFPRVTKAIRLGDYTEEMGETEIRVWVNMPRANIDRIKDLKSLKDEEIFGWLNEVWGQPTPNPSLKGGGIPGDWPVEDIQRLYEHCITEDNDPGLWVWLVSETIRLIFEYRAGVKKV